MGKVNVWLKRSYITAASLIGAISALMLAFTLFSHGYFHEDEEIEKIIAGLHVMYAVSILTLLFTILGLFGACKEKKWPLIVFAVGMILSSLFIFGIEINALTVRPQVAKGMKKQYLDMMKLTNSSEMFLNGFKDAQIALQCCGLDQGYQDWGYNIPESCMCTEEPKNPCVAAPRNSRLFENVSSDQPIMIYKEPCLPFIIDHALAALSIVLGIILGVILLWVLAVVLSIIILCRLSQNVDTPAVVYSKEAKAGNYNILSEPSEFT
ncbi:tetraspanin-8-like [Anabas testudineus]|uniref:Tetraspanin n=1 Tax=Anabas testudineus TaxID=64144 RepID=A0A7N6AC80_ANATE|nr:tetraspanin-8-like [Anabas testudineus]